MTSNRLQQYKASLAYELQRLGFPMEYAIQIDAPYFEFEADKLYASTDKEAVCVDIYRAAKTLWGIPTRPTSSRDIMAILRSVG